MTQMDLRKDFTTISLALEIDSEDTIHGTEEKAAFKETHAIDSTAHARRAESDSETDIHDGTTNIHEPARQYEICHA